MFKGLILTLVILGMASNQIASSNEAKSEKTIQGSISKLEKDWNNAQVRPEWRVKIDKTINKILLNKKRYEGVQNMRVNGVPWPIIAALHNRESSLSFNNHLHEGSPLKYRTRWIPKGRIPDKEPPYTWEESAEDALYSLKGLDKYDWCNLETALDRIERYNGLGYRTRGLVSPYLYSGSTIYNKAKFVSDGRFDPNFVDKQIGAATILKRMIERGIIREKCFK